jgi:hypothetical protein
MGQISAAPHDTACTGRAGHDEQMLQEVIEDLRAVGLRARSGDRLPDQVLDFDRHTVNLEFKGAAVVSPAHARLSR